MFLLFSAQSCQTLCDPMVCPWNSLGKNTEVVCHSLFQGIFPTQELNPSLPHCRQTLDHLLIPINYILDIRLKGKTIKYIKENIEEKIKCRSMCLHDLEIIKDF